ncbi:MAG TPA: cobyric acid synthase [Euzebya sp.]|nr:cobyric acid synthase [Euzebya sp.]
MTAPAPAPSVLVVGTGSDAGKTTLVAGLCRLLARRGVRVAPFKAQNMALNSAVTHDGGEIGRAQALQALACGIPPEVAMNPVLLKPTGERHSQVMVNGRPWAQADAAGYGDLTDQLRPIVRRALDDLRQRFETVICEGAGSVSEINLRDRDLVNTGLARDADLPMILLGDIERGGVFAALYGTWALLQPDERARLRGFVINRFRGDPSLLDAGLAELTARTGVPVLGVLPWLDDLRLDAEDSLGITDRDGGPPLGPDGLDVAVVRLPRISNATDVDALAGEPGVSVTFTTSAGVLRQADLVVLPGTKATTADLAWLRARGLDQILRQRAAAGRPVMGICGGHQMLGRHITDAVEGDHPDVAGLGLLDHDTVFGADKIVRRVTGHIEALGGVPAEGYEIRHGRVDPDDAPVVVQGAVMGTMWHGLLEGDRARRAVLAWVAGCTGRAFVPATTSHHDRRIADLDRLADAVEAHLDVDAILGAARQWVG